MAVKSTEEVRLELEEKRRIASLGGGQKALDKQVERGKLTARDRINALLDPGSFVELDQFVTHRCQHFGMEKKVFEGDGVVTGYGTVEGRFVYVYSQDFSVLGGSLGEMHAKKICKVMDMAMKVGCPVVGINDSGGARIQEAVDALNGYGEIFYRNTLASGVIPQISVIVGPTAGGAVYSPALTDFIFMVDKIGIMHITGPSVIKAVTGEEVTSEQVGGAQVHNSKSGVAHFFATNEQACFADVRTLLGLLPSNNMSDAPLKETTDSPTRMLTEIADLVPNNANKTYDIYQVIKSVVDDGFFFEVQALFARNIIIGYGRLNGQTVGIVANQCSVMAGCLDIDCSDKASRFIRHCDAFNIPVVSFVDVPGYLPGTTQELGGIIRKGAKMLYAYSEATVPVLTVILRKAYGGSYLAMGSKAMGADMVFAWPQAKIAVMGAEGAANVIFKKEIDSSEDPVATRAQKISEYEDSFATPYQAAKRGLVDAVIQPEETRRELIAALELLKTKRAATPKRKHGLIPH